MGYATLDDMEKADIKDFGYGATRHIHFSKLRDIDELIHQEILILRDKKNE